MIYLLELPHRAARLTPRGYPESFLENGCTEFVEPGQAHRVFARDYGERGVAAVWLILKRRQAGASI
jgi:hypothetical protein